MTTKTDKLLEALGHIETPNIRCLAIESQSETPMPGRPVAPPRFCGLKTGHDGPHTNIYGTQRIQLRPELTTKMPGLPSLCDKCNTVWPCKDAKIIIDTLADKKGGGDDGNEGW